MDVVVCGGTGNGMLIGVRGETLFPPDQLDTARPIGISRYSIAGKGFGCNIQAVRVSEARRPAAGPMVAAFFQPFELAVDVFQSQSYFRPSTISPGGPA